MILPLGQLMMATAAGPRRMGRVMSIVAIPAMLAPILGPDARRPDPRQHELALDLLRQPADRRGRASSPRCGSSRASRAVPTDRLDVRGLLLMATGLPLFTYGLAEIGTTGSFTATRVVVPIAGRRSRWSPPFALPRASGSARPLLDLHLYRRATFASASIAMFCLGAALFGGMILMPALLAADPRPRASLDTGLLTAPMGLGMALVMPLVGRLADRLGGGPLALVGVIVTTVATIPFGFIGAHTSILVLCGRDGHPWDRRRPRVHAGDDCGLRVAAARPSSPTRRRS